MIADLRKKAKNDFLKDFIYWWIMQFFGKSMENVRKHGDIKLVKTEKRSSYLVSQWNCHTTDFFSENLLALEMRKTQIIVNKPVYLGLSILELSDTVIYEFWNDYVKPKYGGKVKLCYMERGSFIVYI